MKSQSEPGPEFSFISASVTMETDHRNHKGQLFLRECEFKERRAKSSRISAKT